MMMFLFFVLMVAILAAFVIRLAKKWGFVEWGQIHGNSFFSQLFSCDFCLSWWTGCILAVMCVFITGRLELFGIPFFSTVITLRFL